MPITQIILTLLVPVAGCWSFISVLIYFIFHPSEKRAIAGIKLQGILPSRREHIARELTSYVLESIGTLTSKLFSGSSVIEALRPDIEKQVDFFLKEKLKLAFPLFHQMMGEKTLSRFRTVFLEEVESILPALMQKHGASVFANNEVERAVLAEINAITLADLKKAFYGSAGRYLRRIKILAAGTGLLIGLLQLVIEFLYP